MRRKTRHWGWRAGLVLLSGLALGVLPAHAQPPALFSAVEATTAQATTPATEANPPAGPTVLRQRLAALDLTLLTTARATGAAQAASTPPTLTLNLFADAVFPAQVTRVEATRSGGYALSGHVAGEPLSSFTLVVNGDTVAGSVLTPWDRYEFASPPDPPGPSTRLRTGVTTIRQVDPTSLPGGCELREPPSLPDAEQQTALTVEPGEAAGADSDDPTIIDVAVFYTPAARRGWAAGRRGRRPRLISLWRRPTRRMWPARSTNASGWCIKAR